MDCGYSYYGRKADWPSGMTRKFGFCTWSHHMADWRKENVFYACHNNKDAMDGHSEKYRNCSNDHSPSSASFKLESFIWHCKDFVVKQKCLLHFGIYSFLRKLYGLKWPKDLKEISLLKYIIANSECLSLFCGNAVTAFGMEGCALNQTVYEKTNIKRIICKLELFGQMKSENGTWIKKSLYNKS